MLEVNNLLLFRKGLGFYMDNESIHSFTRQTWKKCFEKRSKSFSCFRE